MLQRLYNSRSGRAIVRFLRIGGYQILGQVVTAAGAFVASYQYDTPEAVMAGAILGSVLASIDKYLRDEAGAKPAE